MDIKETEKKLLELEATLMKRIYQQHRWPLLKASGLYMGSLFLTTFSLASILLPEHVYLTLAALIINFIVHRKILLPLVAEPIARFIEKEHARQFQEITELEEQLRNAMESEQKDRDSN